MSQETLQLLQPVTVKVVMTADFRAQMVAEVERSLGQIEENLQSLTGIRERLPEGENEGETYRVDTELARLRQAREELGWRIKEAQSLQDGAEIFYQKVTSCVTVKVGDEYVASARREILVKDGKVIEIRDGGSE